MYTIDDYINIYPLRTDPNFLYYRNPHNRDDIVKFEEETHTYFVKYDLTTNIFSSDEIISVSTFIHRYFETFDPDSVVKKMKLGRNWNTENKYYFMSDTEIKNKWRLEGELASRRGTWLHGQVERFWNGYDLLNSPYSHLIQINQFFNWKKVVFEEHLQPLRTEMRLVTDSELQLVGTADFLAIRTDHPDPLDCDGVLSVYLIDWKFSKSIKYTNPVGKKGKGVCSSLNDTNFYHYSLQQNMYKWILENYYNDWVLPGKKHYTKIKVVSMQLAVFHENHSECGMIVVLPDHGYIIDKLIEERRLEMQWIKKQQKNREILNDGKVLPYKYNIYGNIWNV